MNMYIHKGYVKTLQILTRHFFTKFVIKNVLKGRKNMFAQIKVVCLKRASAKGGGHIEYCTDTSSRVF
jgi:hypothetical protein